jgi:hypothetical protein
MVRKMTNSEFNRQYRESVIRGRESMAKEPQAKSVRFDQESNRIVVDLKNGVTFAFPSDLVQGLRGAAAEDIAEVELGPRGAALHWEELDVDFSLAGLMAGIFGNKAWMSGLMAKLGSKGGKKVSEAKAAAARVNGAKGGRPRLARAAKSSAK